jgi:hypothetical protein
VIYKSLNRGWYYTRIEIPNLETIKQELLYLANACSNTLVRAPGLFNVFRKDIIDCPAFMSYLATKGLDGKLNRLLYSTGVQGPNPHVDAGNPVNCTYSLNIPLLHAEDSYTVWYNTEKKYLLDFLNAGKDPNQTIGWVDISDATEAHRLQYTGPAVLNTTILHKALANRPDRIVVGARFWPELTPEELDRLGVVLPSSKDSNTL